MRCASHTTVRTGLVYSGSENHNCNRSLHQLQSAFLLRQGWQVLLVNLPIKLKAIFRSVLRCFVRLPCCSLKARLVTATTMTSAYSSAQICLVCSSCLSGQSFAVWLTSVHGLLHTTLPLANASGTLLPHIRDLHSLASLKNYIYHSGHTQAVWQYGGATNTCSTFCSLFGSSP